MPYSELLGKEVDASSEEWRHECEVRTVIAMPSKAARLEYLFGVEEVRNGTTYVIKRGVKHVRGIAAAERIRDDAMRLYYLRLERAQSATNQENK